MQQDTEFLNLFNANRGIVYKLVNLYADDAEDRKDLYQEVLYQSLKSFERFNGNSAFSTWLYRVALNTALTFLKKEQKRRTAESELPHDEAYTPDEGPELLYHYIKSLNPVDKMIISAHLDGFSNPEIAEITGLEKNHVGVKLHRIKDYLVKKMRHEQPQ